MQDNQIKREYRGKSTYYIFVFLLTILEFLSVYSSAHNMSFQIYSLITIITASIMGFIGITIFLTTEFDLKKIGFLFALFIIYWSSNFNNFWVVPICIAVSFANFTLYDLICAYCTSNLVTLVITVFLAVVGLAPMNNPADGVLSLGFATQSALGLVLTLISFIFVLEIVKYKKNTKYYLFKIFFILFGFILKIVVLDDRTMTWTFLVFLVLIMIFRLNKKFIIILMKIIGLVSPFLLLYISWKLTTNYISSNFFYELDNFFSHRLLMWNWYYQKAPISLFPNTFRLSDFNYWGTIDGSYALLLLQYGIIMALIVCLLLALCNYLLLKYKHYGVFCMMLSLELAAFVENILQFYVGAIPLILMLLILNLGWLKNNILELVKENK